MTDAPPPAPRRPHRALLLIAALILVAVAIWISQLYTTEAARECRALYDQARTAIDTNRIDLTVPAAGRKLSEPRSCVNYRRRMTP